MAEGPREGLALQGKKNNTERLIFQTGSEGQGFDRTSWKGVGGRNTDKAGFVEEGSENLVTERGLAGGAFQAERASCARYFICKN